MSNINANNWIYKVTTLGIKCRSLFLLFQILPYDNAPSGVCTLMEEEEEEAWL
jgi:hypothetical protein